MTIQFRCRHCEHKLRAPDAAAGQQARCKCGRAVVVPPTSDPEFASSPDPAPGKRATPAGGRSPSAPSAPTEAIQVPPASRAAGSGGSKWVEEPEDDVPARASHLPAGKAPVAVPALVRIYAILFMILSGVGLARWLRELWEGEPLEIWDSHQPFNCVFGFLIFVASIAIWNEVRRGRRWAVRVIQVLAGLGFVGTFVLGLFGWASSGMFGYEHLEDFIGYTLVLVVAYVPPLVSAHRHWQAFH